MSTEKKKESKKKKIEFEPFIQTVIHKEIRENLGWISEACSKYAGIGEIPKDVWDRLNNLVLSISMKARDYDFRSYHLIDAPFKMDKYTISHRVREKQRKEAISIWLERLTSEDEQHDIFVCYQIFSQIAIWIRENSRLEKKSSKKNSDEEIFE